LAKRFTDTGKWDKAWFRKLPAEMKCVWMFLCDRCDHAGIWDIDDDALEFFTGADTSIDEILVVFGDKIQRVGDSKLLIPGFVDFQYGGLNPDNRVHKSVLDRLQKLTPSKDLPRTLEGPKDKDTDKDKDKDKGECEGKRPDSFAAAFDADAQEIFGLYPKFQSKTESLGLIANLTPAQRAELRQAITNFCRYHEAQKTEAKFIPLFPGWFRKSWRDWLDPENGKSKINTNFDWDKVFKKGEHRER
jgi:hypothetical protein